MLVEAAAVADAPRYAPIDAAPSVGQLADLEQLLAKATRPVAILGGSRWSEQAVQQFAAFAERHALPTSVSFRRQMLFPADHPCYIGDVGLGINPALLKRVADADLILLVGGRMSETPARPTPCWTSRCRARSWSMCIPTAPSWRACTAPRWRSIPRPPLSPRRWPA